LESISKSPILQNFGETISGSHVIRAFSMAPHFITKNYAYLDLNSKLSIANYMAQLWLSINFQLMSTFFTALCIGLIVGLRGSINPSVSAMCMYNMMVISSVVYYFALSISEVENSMVSWERASSMTSISSEAPRSRPPDATLDTWPTSGAIVFVDYSMRYRDNTELVLRNVNLSIAG